MTEPPPDPDQPLEPPLEEEPRRYPSTIGGTFYVAILVTAAVAVAIVMNHDWRPGVKVLSGALGTAGVMRLLLSEKDAGMLAVRHRFVDVFLLVGVALALYYLAGNIPDQPPL